MTDDSMRGAARNAADRAYFEGRAAWHRDRATAAQDVATRDLHQRFATLYAARALA